jgi:hypothetical protein
MIYEPLTVGFLGEILAPARASVAFARQREGMDC